MVCGVYSGPDMDFTKGINNKWISFGTWYSVIFFIVVYGVLSVPEMSERGGLIIFLVGYFPSALSKGAGDDGWWPRPGRKDR